MDQEQTDGDMTHRLPGPFQEWSFDSVNKSADNPSDETKNGHSTNKTDEQSFSNTRIDETGSDSASSGDSSEYATPPTTSSAGHNETSTSGQQIQVVHFPESAGVRETESHTDDDDVIMTDVIAGNDVQINEEWNPTPEELLAIAFADEDQEAGNDIQSHREDAPDEIQVIDNRENQIDEHEIQRHPEDAQLASENPANVEADTIPQPENPWGMSDAQLEQLRIDQDRHFGYIYDRDSAPKPFSCVCGEASMDPSGFVNLTCPDNCVRCVDCLNANVRVGLESKKNYPPRCCIPIDFENVFYHLELTLIDRWLDIRPEFEDIAPVYCSVKECSVYLPRDLFIEEGKWALCTKCNIKTCTACLCPKSQHDENSSACPERLDKMDKDLMRNQGWKSCPQCREMIERTEGCDHMTCECGHQFCYGCGRSFEPPMPCNCHGQNQWAEEIQGEADPRRQEEILRHIADGEDVEPDEAEDEQEDEQEDEGEDEVILRRPWDDVLPLVVDNVEEEEEEEEEAEEGQENL